MTISVSIRRLLSRKKSWLYRGEKSSPFIKIISLILIVSMINLTTSCYYYRVNIPKNPDSNTIANLHAANKFIVLHFEGRMWQLESLQINEKSIGGTVSELKQPTRYKETDPSTINRYYKNQKINESWVLNEVHIHISEYADLGNSQVNFPIEAIRKIEVYDHDSAATAGSWIFGTVGVVAGVTGVIFLAILMLKESCPFIYVYDGEDYKFVGEIYSGSVYPQLERLDYLKLPLFDETNLEYRVKITNEVQEIQHTNFCELLVFDHPEGMDVLVDKSGNIHTIMNLTTPKNAFSLTGKDLSMLIEEKDSLHYFGQHVERGAIKDGLILEFEKPQDAKTAKIVISAKNSFFLDYMMGQFHNLFGDIYHKWVKRQRKATEEHLRKWTLDQNIPLSLFVERNGNWEFIDYYHIAGPMAFKNDVLAIPLTENDSNPLKVKFEWGANLWEIDFVAADFSENRNIKSYNVPIREAFSNSKKNVKNRLKKIDRKYYTQSNVGDYADLYFDLPKPIDERRSVILHTKGYYQVLRNPTGTPNISYLKTFIEPGQFNRFCNEHIELLITGQNLE